MQARTQVAQVHAVYSERAATLQAEGEAVSLYPAVIAALAGSNPAPLVQWSGQVAALQGIDVTVVDAAGGSWRAAMARIRRVMTWQRPCLGCGWPSPGSRPAALKPAMSLAWPCGAMRQCGRTVEKAPWSAPS